MENEFLHKELTENEKLKIKERAKEIMKNFEEKLSEIDELEIKTTTKKEFARKENSPCEKKIDKEIMLQNAPKKNKDFIIAETKNW